MKEYNLFFKNHKCDLQFKMKSLKPFQHNIKNNGLLMTQKIQ